VDTLNIAIGKLRRRVDARQLDRAVVNGLAASIRELGVINPLRVREITIFESGREAKGYEVIAGSHRLQAGLDIGVADLPCIVVGDDDLRAELAMIDENLCRAELSPADRASQTARRKAIYLELHPETAQHVAGAHASNEAQGNAAANFAVASFASATAEATGKAERTIRLDAERGEKVAEDALNLIRGTALDTGTYLDKLKRIDPTEQVETVQRALAGVARQAERDRAETLAARNKSRVEADVKQRAAKEVADILAEHVPGELWDALKANLYAAGATSIAAAFTNMTGEAVMDRSAA
jgi:ParB-like chromosome segregation protein Spo0J